VLSEAPGAGDWLHGGFVTYAKEDKTAVLRVPADLIERAGIVSGAVARAMARARSHARRQMWRFQSPAPPGPRPKRTAHRSGTCTSLPRGAGTRPFMRRTISATSAAARTATKPCRRRSAC
jgi:nicotinamide mononucleotide (NMN) deamidase PncC